MTTLTGTVVTARGVHPGQIVTLTGDTITSVVAGEPAPEEPLIVPGFIDLHCHGGRRGSFPDGDLELCRTAARHHRSRGTTTLIASLVSASGEHLLRQVPLLATLAEEGEIAGIHLEGPFINQGKCGAQDPAAIIPGDPELFARLIDAGRGQIRSLTFAPETAGVDKLLELCAEHDIIASLGHTDADHEQTAEVIAAAVDRGVTVTATHLFNAMPTLHHRDPGPVAALLSAAAAGDAHVEIIADGVHLADDTVDMVLSTVGDGAFFVSDAMQAAGMPDGQYTLGTLDVTVAGGVARLSTTDGHPGAIAGGTSTIADQFARHLLRGVPPTTLVAATSTTPARVLGMDDRIGDIAPGHLADLLVLDSQGRVQEIYSRGHTIEPS